MAACGWEVIGCDECTAYQGLSPELQAEVDAWAVWRLWEWTNQRFGPCEYTILSDSHDGCCWLGHPFDACHCRRSGLLLPGPIAEPVEVLVGIDLDPVDLSDLRVVDWNVLEFTDGTKWGRDWEVTYLLGEEVPAGGEIVAGILACEYAKSVCGDASCRLPKRVSSIQRQGIVINNVSSRTAEMGITGIFEIDDWIMTATKPKRRSVASSPDVPKHRIVTWTNADS